ncbi:MAG: FG-GAP repeat domain-containing protein, partial [Gemmatimonadaceae bacterium]
ANRAAARSAPAGTVIEALADVNGDGRSDAVITHSDRNILGVLLNEKGVAFASAPAAPIPLPGQSFAVAVADVNADGKADLIASSVRSTFAPYDSHVAVFLGGASGFAKAPGSPFPSGRGAFNLAIGDINKDGRPDVVSSSFEGDAVSILLGSPKAASRQ